MDIGTAKATAAEREVVPHHGLDIADPDERVTVADWMAHATEALRRIATHDGVALLVGGTGLYLRTLARGLPVTETGHDPRVRGELEERLGRDGLESLVAELLARSPVAGGAVDLRNPRRVVRALERAIVSGDALPPKARGYPGPVLWLGVAVEPAELRERIEARVRAHFAGGLLDEASALRARFGESAAAFSAMGYREAFDVLDRRISLEQAIAHDAARTRAFARRQRTWFRAEPGVTWLASGKSLGRAARDAVDRFLDQAAQQPEPR
jgi:tRNA dimethylallyltransferase